MSRRRGSILLIVLFVMSVLGMLGLSLAYRAGIWTRATRRDIVMARLESQANSAVVVAVARIARNDAGYDHLAQAWHTHVPLCTERWLDDWAEPDRPGTVSEFEADYVTIDESGKLNVAFASSEALEKLGLSHDQIAALRDWSSTGENAESGGAKSDYYLSLPRPYLCKGAPIEVLEELTLIRGFDSRTYLGRAARPWGGQTGRGDEMGLVEFLTVVGDGKINPNTTSEAVLRTLPISEDAVQQILSYRQSPSSSSEDIANHAFRSTEDIDQLQGLSKSDRAVLHGLVRFSSEYFRVLAWARHRPSGFVYQLDVLVRRTEKGVQILQWRQTA